MFSPVADVVRRAVRCTAPFAAAAFLAFGSVVAAEPAGIESVRISRTGDTADVDIRFACRNRFLSLSPTGPAPQSEITLIRMDWCANSGDATREATRPTGHQLAALKEIGYTSRGGTDAILSLHFDRAVLLKIEQSGDLHMLRLQVHVPAGSVPDPATDEPFTAAAVPIAPPALSPEQIARAEERARRAMEPRPAAPRAAADFVLNLRSTTMPVDVMTEAKGIAQGGQLVYVSDLKVDDQVWHRLRLGFFVAEADANAALRRARSRFPDAWVGRVSATERRMAGSATVEPGGVAATPAGSGPGTLGEAELSKLLVEARSAFIDRDYPQTIQLTVRILEAPLHAGTPEARELLGLARERDGQTAAALAEYQRYIADYPDSDGAVRVRQRLAALSTALEQPRESIRGKADAGRDSAWEVYGGVSQFYRRDSVDFGGDSATVEQSALFSDADLVARYTGQRFDFGSRATLAYTWDMSGSEPKPGNQTRVYNLYTELSDRELDVSARLGRQTLRNQGVLGRFDGAIVSWQWAPDYRLNLLAGFPVYSSEQSIDTSRHFYGFSVDVLDLLKLFDLNLFYNIQEVDGVSDREAVGAELRYFGSNRSFIASMDYDIAYGELNSLVALGNWTFDNRTTVNARFDWRNTPYLTTESALVGQSASSIQGLLLSYTEGEIRQLALDRSGGMHSLAFGLARPLSERFQISADITASQYDATEESGGVRETPDSGTLIYSYLSLIATSLIREGDVSILGMRYSEGGSSKSTALFIDTRYPLTQNLRLNPKLLLSRQEISEGDATELLVRPGLRVLYRMARHFQVEVEAGGELGRHDNGAGETNDSSGYYMYMGYSADF